jgi:hypothetical protein
MELVVPSIYEVSNEYVIGCGYLTSLAEQLQEVEELAMYVPANDDGTAHWVDVTLFDEDLFGLFTYEP